MGITVSEDVQMCIPALTLTVNDMVEIIEAVALEQPLLTSVYDSIELTEVVTGRPLLKVTVNDELMLTENVFCIKGHPRDSHIRYHSDREFIKMHIRRE